MIIIYNNIVIVNSNLKFEFDLCRNKGFNDIFPKVGFVCNNIHYIIDITKILQISSIFYYKFVTQIHV